MSEKEENQGVDCFNLNLKLNARQPQRTEATLQRRMEQISCDKVIPA